MTRTYREEMNQREWDNLQARLVDGRIQMTPDEFAALMIGFFQDQYKVDDLIKRLNHPGEWVEPDERAAKSIAFGREVQARCNVVMLLRRWVKSRQLAPPDGPRLCGPDWGRMSDHDWEEGESNGEWITYHCRRCPRYRMDSN